MVWVRTLLFALTLVATVLVLIPQWIVRADGVRPLTTTGPTFVAGLLLVALGAALMLWCWWEFVARGKGTPAPFDPPRRLVIRGPYRYVRNPMYVAALGVLLGQAALFGAASLLVYATGFWLATHAFVTGYEERALARRFGEEYAAYRAVVGRWIPRGAWRPERRRPERRPPSS